MNNIQADLERYDIFFEKDDLFSKMDEDLFRNALFSNECSQVQLPKQENKSEHEAEDLWQSFLDSEVHPKDQSNLNGWYNEHESIQKSEFVSINSVFSSLEGGMEYSCPKVVSSATDLQPVGISSPENDYSSADTLDVDSELSSTSDLGSLSSLGESFCDSSTRVASDPMDASPSNLLSDVKEMDYGKEVASESQVSSNDSRRNSDGKGPNFYIRKNNGSLSPLKSGTISQNSPSKNPDQLNGCTIVLNEPGKTPILKRASFNNANLTKKSILLPLNIKDINQVKTIKIISAGNVGSTRTLISSLRPTAALQDNPQPTFYTASKTPLIHVTPAAGMDSNISSSLTIKEEASYSDDETHQNGQELILTDEEKRLLKKEGIFMPSQYPLTKHEERDLKRIRRKIRNKISAQDSRKRKKEYVDGLEDRVKNCSEENNQLQKRIRYLESQNETLVVQLKKFHTLVNGGSSSNRSQAHTSTALMMLILSAALLVVPSLRPQEGAGGEKEIATSQSMPTAGHSRSLLEAGLNINPMEAGVNEEEVTTSDTHPLADHDYAPFAKRQKKSHYFFPPSFYDFPSSPPSGRGGIILENHVGSPDQKGGGASNLSLFAGALLDRVAQDAFKEDLRSFFDPFEEEKMNKSSLVVNLHQNGKLKDIEVE